MQSSKLSAQARLGPLHYAVLTRDYDDVSDLLQQGVDVIAQNRDGDTALHMLRYPRKRLSVGAVFGNRYEEDIIWQLCSADERCFRAVDAAGNTPLMSCVNTPDTSIDVILALMGREQKVLKNGIDFDIVNNDNESVLDLAFASGKPEIITAICTIVHGLTVSATAQSCTTTNHVSCMQADKLHLQ